MTIVINKSIKRERSVVEKNTVWKIKNSLISPFNLSQFIFQYASYVEHYISQRELDPPRIASHHIRALPSHADTLPACSYIACYVS